MRHLAATIRKFFRSLTGSSVSLASQSAEAAAPRPEEETAEQQEEARTYSTDQPISRSDQDRFGRWAFAQRVADTLAEREDPSSLVIALYGPWGDGKTSALHLMAEALEKHEHVVLVRFNPWYFESEEQLIRGLFGTIAETLGKSLPNRREEVGRILHRYGALLSIASVGLAGGAVQLNPGSGVEGLGKALSTVEVDELKQRLEKLLRESGRRVVIMVDDIDRLDRDEIHVVFKLVKLSAGFEYTSYVLAFDHEVVAAALGMRYGAGDVEAGHRFLEKIVQVPLHLPPAEELELRKFTFEGVNAALKRSEIELDREQIETFAHRFIAGLEIQLNTPRRANLYGNALTFALPLLKGEVNPVDHMLIEGIRVFYPKLYKIIRDNPSRFLAAPSGARHDERQQQTTELIDSGLSGMGESDKRKVRSLLEHLFPRLSNMGYGSDWDEAWAREQRICSEAYFKRYFSYAVPVGDVPDAAVGTLIDLAEQGNQAALDQSLTEISESNGVKRLIFKLRTQEEAINATAARHLAIAIARNGSVLPREQEALISDWTFMQGAILISKLVCRIDAGDARDEMAREIVRSVESLPFALECFRWIRKDPGDGEEKRKVPESVENELGLLLANRIRDRAEGGPLYREYGADAPRLFYVWHTYGDAEEVTRYLEERFEERSEECLAFLSAYVGRAWDVGSGVSHAADFDRDSYNAVARLISPDRVMAKLREQFGEELDTPSYHHPRETPFENRLAQQFAFVHQGVIGEVASEGPEEDQDGET